MSDGTPTRHDDETPRRLDLAAWRELFGFVLRDRRRAWGLLGTALLVAAVDTAFPLVTRRVVDEILAHGAQARLAGPALAYAALLLVLAASILAFIRLAGTLATHVAHDIRVAAFARLEEMPFAYYDRRPTGWLMARMTSDCDRLARILAWGLLDGAWGVALMLSIAGVLLALSWRLGLVVLAVVPVLVWVSIRFQRLILGSARAVRKANSRLTAAYTEDLMGVRTTKALVREDESQAEFSELSRDMHRASVRNALQSAVYLPTVLTLGSVAAALALSVGAGQVALGFATVGTLVAFVQYALRFFDPVNELAATFAQLQMAQAAAERVLGILHARPEIADGEHVRAAPAGTVRRIELRDVGFAYGAPGESPEVLSDVELVVDAGTLVALVGPTGGGKTTLASLVARFYEPTRGSVLLDGVDYRELPLAWWRSQVSVVLQQPFLFMGTVRENIRYGRLDASDAEVEEAARRAGAHEVVTALSDGYDTQVGERGALLSTGQAQLVSIARALLADRPVLVLDEATSSVDGETERLVQAGLREVMRGRTSFVIAHRLSTIRNADVILVIDAGRIVQRGTHAQLVQRAGLYRELALEQGIREARWAG